MSYGPWSSTIKLPKLPVRYSLSLPAAVCCLCAIHSKQEAFNCCPDPTQARGWLPFYQPCCLCSHSWDGGVYILSIRDTLPLYLPSLSLVSQATPGEMPFLLLLSRFSHVRLCVTLQKAAHQAPLSLGFSRQEHWSGLPFPSPMHESEKWKWTHSVVSDS